MKIQPQNIPPPVFTPLTITLETPEEVAKLYAIFGFVPILDALDWNCSNINDELYNKLVVANNDAGNEPIVYEKWHIALDKALHNRNK